jgi:broad specificity phosphatase PhoE
VIKVLVCLWLGLPVVNYNRFSVEPASVSLVRISDGYGYLGFLNDTSHLRFAIETCENKTGINKGDL